MHRIIRQNSEGASLSVLSKEQKPSNDDSLVYSKLCPVPGAERLRVSQFTDLQRLRRLLRDGCEGHMITPFVFHAHDGGQIVAENSGLEGFIFSQRRFQEQYGTRASEAHTADYFIYVASVLEGEGYGAKLLSKVKHLASSDRAQSQKHHDLVELVRAQVEAWRQEVEKIDHARWARHVRAYQVFPRTFNIDGFRELHQIRAPANNNSNQFFNAVTGSDLDAIRGLGFTALRMMGVFPIGSTNAKGTAGGSPYSIMAHDIDPAHGSRSDAKRTFELARERGMLSIFEVVPNHTACDSTLLKTNPDFFVHTREKPADPSGYFYYEHPKYGEYWIRYGGYRDLGTGRREFWTDTLQLDFSRPETRQYVISEICDLIRNYSLDGIRVDSAYQLLNEYLLQNWGSAANGQKSELSFDLPPREFLAELVAQVKYEFPHVVIMAEAFTGFDKLAECGVDLIYGISSMVRNGGHLHTGWNEALASRDPARIRAAIQRAEFLSWQVGGPDIVTFFGHQDFPSPTKMFGKEWVYGAAVLSILRPGASSFYAGTEACYEEPCDEPGFKVVSFNKPARIKWEGTAQALGQFQLGLLKLSRSIQQALGERTTLEAIAPNDEDKNSDWVGYIIRSKDASIPWKLAVVVNTSSRPVDVNFTDPDTKRAISFPLPPTGPEGYQLIQLDNVARERENDADDGDEDGTYARSHVTASHSSDSAPEGTRVSAF